MRTRKPGWRAKAWSRKPEGSVGALGRPDSSKKARRLGPRLAARSSHLMAEAPEQLAIPDPTHDERGDPEVPSESLGRRDWTRTNDPHHVKVVL